MSTKIKSFITRSFVFLCIMAVFITILPAQIAYYDAIELSKLGNISIENGKVLLRIFEGNEKLLKILAFYAGIKEDSPSNIEKSYNDNPFIIFFLERTMKMGPTGGEEPKIKSVSDISSTATGISTPVSTIVEGMAKFLVERAKEELSIAFFQKFKDELAKGKDGYEILKKVFPETHVILQTIGEEIYNFSSYIQVLREAFEKDLSNIYTNLPKALNSLPEGKIKEFFEKNKWLKNLIETAFFIGNGIKEEIHPGQMLAEFNAEKLNFDKVGNLKNAIKLLKIISGSLKGKNNSVGVTNGNGKYWVTRESLNKLFERQDDCVFILYLGLIYQQLVKENIEFVINSKPIKPIDIIKNQKEKITALVEKIKGFRSRIDLMETALRDLNDLIELKRKDKEGKELTFDDYHKAYDSIVDMFEYFIEFYDYALRNIPDNPCINVEESIKKYKLRDYVNIVRNLTDIYLNIKYRQYGIAVFKIINVSDMICQLYGSKLDSQPIAQDSNKPENDPIFNNIRSKFLKYGSFMAAVTQAKTSDEVKKAIESVALPVGSYRIKRTRPFSISLNSYVGILPGQEKYIGKYTTDNNNNTPPDKEWIENLAITAPIGIAFNNGEKLEGKYTGSLSLFVSLIDLGAIVRYRFEKEEKETTEEEKGISGVTWKDIFSPGAFLIWGPKNLPLSFGFGLQVSPQIKKVYDDGTIDRTLSRIRWGIMIAVDIPLIHFK